VLETANIKLASVASDVVGVSGRAMLQALVEGNADAQVRLTLIDVGAAYKKGDRKPIADPKTAGELVADSARAPQDQSQRARPEARRQPGGVGGDLASPSRR